MQWIANPQRSLTNQQRAHVRHSAGKIRSRKMEAVDGWHEEEESVGAIVSGSIRLHDPQQNLPRMAYKVIYQNQREEVVGARERVPK